MIIMKKNSTVKFKKLGINAKVKNFMCFSYISSNSQYNLTVYLKIYLITQQLVHGQVKSDTALQTIQ